MKPIEHMTTDELVAEGRRLQTEMSKTAEQLNHVYTVLYSKARRNPDFSTPALISMSNAGKRLAGMAVTALKRTAQTERLLAASKQQQADLEREEKEKKEARERKAGKPINDPYSDLFGPDIARDPLETEFLVNPEDLNDVYGEEV